MATWKNSYVFPAHQFINDGGDDQENRTKQTDSGTETDAYALPLCLRKLANRNNDIFTRNDRLNKITKSKYVKDGKGGKWQHSNEKIEKQKPRFLPTQCLVRVVWRIISLDNRIPKKLAYLFTLLGTVVITMVTTLLYTAQQIETQTQTQAQTQTLENSGNGTSPWVAWGNSLWLVLLALCVLGVLEFLLYVYKVWFVPQQQLLKEMRFEYAISSYTRHNPYTCDYSNEYNGANEQDPDAVLVWLMDDEEEFEHKLESRYRARRCGRCFRRFCLLDFIPKRSELSIYKDELGVDYEEDGVNRCCYMCCFRCYR